MPRFAPTAPRSLDRGAPILIAGAGIAGLVAALSLERAGFTNLRLLDASGEDQQTSTGVDLLPNAVRELTELGLLPRLASRGVLTASLELRHCRGGLIWREPRGMDAGHAWPQLAVHRRVLFEELHRALRERLGPGVVRRGQQVMRADGPAGAVRVWVRDESTGVERIERAALVIGADGVSSALRAQRRPQEGAAMTNGLTAWSGAAWVRPFADATTMRIVGDERRRIVVFPVLHGPNDLVLTSWHMTIPTAVADATPPAARPAVAADQFRGWVTPGVDVEELVAATDEVVSKPMADRDPLDRWVYGGTALIGDAAHPMFPAGSAGASQAIIDARVLVARLAREAPAAALEAYDAERRPILGEIQRANRVTGPEVAISIVHRRAPEGFDHIDDVIGQEELQAIAERYAAIGGFLPDELNRRPSLDPSRLVAVPR